MTRLTLALGVAALTTGLTTVTAQQPQPPAQPQPFSVGNPLGLPINPAPTGTFNPISPNVKVFGSLYSAESCSYDPVRNLIVVPSRGVPQEVQTNNAWVSLLNHDGSVHTARWIGIQGAGAERDNLKPRLVLNEPYGSDIVNGVLYLADRDGGTGPNDPSVAVIRRFDMKSGAPTGETRVSGAPWFNDIAVAANGTVYATVSGVAGGTDPSAWQVWRVMPDGTASVFVRGAPLSRPNGIALDQQGRVVVVNVNSPDVLIFSTDGTEVLREQAAQSGNDGLVIMKDGTKYISSVVNGGITRIRPGQPATLIAQNIPNAASMCYDAGANQLVIPMNANNAVALLKLD